MLTLMSITNDPLIAKCAVEAGVDRIFVDWEIINKVERQGHLSTVISRHEYEDAKIIRDVIPDAEMLVRINPFFEGTNKEVELAVDAGADLIMLPMFKSMHEIEKTMGLIDGRAKFVPLLETSQALVLSQQLAELDDVYEIYVGLNDLYLSLGMNFIFQPVSAGLVDSIAAQALMANKRFGFGGVARLGEGLVNAEYVLSEHSRLGSSSVILSRTFFRGMDRSKDISAEIEKLKNVYDRLEMRSDIQKNNDKLMFDELVAKVSSRV